MLDSLRKAAGTWVAKLLLILLVASFAVWGISGQIVGGLTGNAVITAGETTVSAIEYRLAYDRQIQVLSQRFGQQITREQAQALGVDNQVLAQLVAGAVLDEQARKMGLGLSDQRLAQLTAEDPAFQGPDGEFDRARFEYVLRQVGMRPEDYLKNRGQVAVRQQIVEAISDGMNAPSILLKAVAVFQGESRTIDFVTLPGSIAGEISDPDPKILQAWFEDRKDAYRAPEYRKIAYVKLAPEDIADSDSISDDVVRADYENNISRYTTPESRKVEQLVFKTNEEAEQALEKIRGGATFDEIIAAEGKAATDVQLGTVTKSEIADPAIADVAFSLNENSVSEVVNGAFGPVLIRVTEIKPEIVQPFEEVKEKIRTEIAINEASRVLLDIHDEYEDSRAAGQTLAEAAEKLNLKVVTVEAVDRSAQTPEGKILDDLPQSAELLRGSFETEPGMENPAISLSASGYLFYEVLSVTPARDRNLEEVREQVIADWKAAERSRIVSEKAAEIEKKIADGASFPDAIGEIPVEEQTKYGLKRGATDADLGESGVEAVFSVPVNAIGTVRGPQDDSWIVFKVTERFEPAGVSAESLPENVRQSFSSGIADDLLDQLVTRLQEEYEVTVNQTAINLAMNF